MLHLDFDALGGQVLREVDRYEPPRPHPEQVGSTPSPDWFQAGLDRMRRALVVPYALIVVDQETNFGQVATREVIVVADDGNAGLLAFDPNAEGDFVLIWRRPGSISLSHVRGDAVGCFLAI